MDCCLHIKVLQWLLSSALVKMIENNMKGRNRKVVNKSEHELLSYKKYKDLSRKFQSGAMVGWLPPGQERWID